MEWGIVFELIDPMLLVVVAACWCLGYMLKQTPFIPDWLIVYLITFAAVLLTIWLTGFGPEAVIQGVLCGAFSVYGHQLMKQTKEGARRDHFEKDRD
jgi:hypothetical protein